MPKTIKFVYTTHNQWGEEGRCFSVKSKTLQALTKPIKIGLEEMATTFMKNIYPTMRLILRYTPLVSFTCMLKQESPQLWMELLRGTNWVKKNDSQLS